MTLHAEDRTGVWVLRERKGHFFYVKIDPNLEEIKEVVQKTKPCVKLCGFFRPIDEEPKPRSYFEREGVPLEFNIHGQSFDENTICLGVQELFRQIKEFYQGLRLYDRGGIMISDIRYFQIQGERDFSVPFGNKLEWTLKRTPLVCGMAQILTKNNFA